MLSCYVIPLLAVRGFLGLCGIITLDDSILPASFNVSIHCCCNLLPNNRCEFLSLF